MNSVMSCVRSVLIVGLVGAVAACNQGAAPAQNTPGPSTGDKDQEAAAAADSLSAVSTALIKPVFPDSTAVSAMNLDYVTFRLTDNGGVSVVPLPPHFDQVAKVHLASNGGGYDIVAGGAECKDSMIVRVGGKDVATLDPKVAAPFHLPVDSTTYPDGVELSVDMAPSAQANFSCGISVTPGPATNQG